ncbi:MULTISPECIES: hypothetical protein [Arthrobacter]|uniref:Transmembrane protein n=1 Tax=Arthrobacter terricola TaxID=2547396 RepID=A0A4R5KAT2_9MICC|nr:MULTISPECIES: hypothetical protein [Arthrobacter]MBT8162971.1 hypothetical protein [Arthrobacter sp. GN70]TDF91625.1 hypothetical protein E1809_20080 [Arthrobacter terricola]
MTNDEEESALLARALEQLRVSRLHWVILVGACVALVVLFVMSGAGLWHWWPWRAWMVPALLIPVVFVLMAVFSLNAPERVRKRLWVRRGILLVPPLLIISLVAWAAGDLIGFSGGFYGGLGAGIGVTVANVMMQGWPRKPKATP